MTALQPLLDADCGTSNPLIEFSRFYTHDQTVVKQDGIINRSSNRFLSSNVDGNRSVAEFVDEYYTPISAPKTFHLDSLLTEIRSSDTIVDKPVDEWTQEYLHSTANDMPQSTAIHYSSSQMTSIEGNYIPSSFIIYSHSTFLTLQPSSIPAEFDHDTVNSTESILSYLREKQVAVNTECAIRVDIGLEKEELEHEANDTHTLQAADISNNVGNAATDNEETLRSQSRLLQFVDQHPEYRFSKANPFLDCANAFEEGFKHLERDDIVNAILCFEAAIEQKPDHTDAWLHLGRIQCHNEQDCLAIYALKKCLELDSKNLQAYLILAACYTNMMCTKEAFTCLYQWLTNHSKYSQRLSYDRLCSMVKNNELTFEQLEDLFFQAVAVSNSSNLIDSDLQVCLGILFHLHDDYDKAAECFNTAVCAKPHDASLWNKLGAAIANGGHNEKAVDAYCQALILSPSYIRARSNLGIACLNLKAYRQAIEHFLIALKQQTTGLYSQGTSIRSSENIWKTLAIAVDRLGRTDLIPYLRYQDLSKLFREFQIE